MTGPRWKTATIDAFFVLLLLIGRPTVLLELLERVPIQQGGVEEGVQRAKEMGRTSQRQSLAERSQQQALKAKEMVMELEAQHHRARQDFKKPAWRLCKGLVHHHRQSQWQDLLRANRSRWLLRRSWGRSGEPAEDASSWWWKLQPTVECGSAGKDPQSRQGSVDWRRSNSLPEESSLERGVLEPRWGGESDLAAGSVRMRQDTGTGTLYSEDPNLQPIVPLADVIKVGVVVKWDSSGCEMRYRSGEKLPVFLQDGCPMLPMQRGMELLYEVEEFNRRKVKLRRAVTHPQPDRDREEEFMSRLARLFPEVPLRILERVPGKLNYDNDTMAINRRTRRQVERAETVILNLFSGPNIKIWTSHGQKGLLILNVEVLKGTDLLESNFYGYLEAQARFGRFSAIYAGPPCKTVSFCRFGHDQDGGPPPLRAREGALRFGLPWISPEQQGEADIDSTLWIKTLWLIHLARGSRSDFLFMVEQPRDPKEWREDDYALISELSVLAGDWPSHGSL